MTALITLAIGFLIGYLASSLVGAAMDYEMPDIEHEDDVTTHRA